MVTIHTRAIPTLHNGSCGAYRAGVVRFVGAGCFFGHRGLRIPPRVANHNSARSHTRLHWIHIYQFREALRVDSYLTELWVEKPHKSGREPRGARKKCLGSYLGREMRFRKSKSFHCLIYVCSFVLCARFSPPRLPPAALVGADQLAQSCSVSTALR